MVSFDDYNHEYDPESDNVKQSIQQKHPTPLGYWEYLAYQKKRFLATLPQYPDFSFQSLRIITHIYQSKMYSKLVPILQCIKHAEIETVGKDITVLYTSIANCLDDYSSVIRFLHAIYTWKKSLLLVNEQPISISSIRTIDYLFSYLAEITGRELKYEDPIQKQKKKQKKNEVERITLVDFNQVLQLFIDRCLHSLSYAIVLDHEFEKVILVQQTLVLYVGIPSSQVNKTISPGQKYFWIQQLTYNDLYVYKPSMWLENTFSRLFRIEYYAFRGYKYASQCMPMVGGYMSYVNRKCPKLRLKKRYDEHPGVLYRFVIFQIKGIDGQVRIMVGTTKGSVLQFVKKVCHELETTPWNSLRAHGMPTHMTMGKDLDAYKAFQSWKGKSLAWRIENIISYYTFDSYVKDEAYLYKHERQVYLLAIEGKIDVVERSTYKKPVNRWKTQELVYNLVKEMYGSYRVIYQYKPSFLRTDKGQMSYDIFICDKKIAIQYQGKQHFEPVEYFGGQSHFSSQVERDKLKLELSKQNGVTLIYINYNQNISSAAIKEKIANALNNQAEKWCESGPLVANSEQ